MSGVGFPEGSYLSLAGRIRADTGGQTHALLLRNRLFAEWAGVEPVLLSLDNSPYYPRIRETLDGRGLLAPGTRLLNIFEWYRERDLGDLPVVGDALPELTGLDRVTVPHPDGTLYQTRYVQRHSNESRVIDYHRADGSVYLRVPAGAATTVSGRTPALLVNGKGQPVGRWPTQRGWRRDWIPQVLDARPDPAERAFMISDSRFAIVDVLPLSDPRLHVLHVVHNRHLRGEGQINSPVNPEYVPVLERISELDALVTLTARQGGDIAARFGETDNLYVVAHPVDGPAPSAPLPGRDRHRFVLIGRLEPQKAVPEAVAAFALVLAQEPAARLDIYGEGSQRSTIAAEIERLGVGAAVTLHGHDPLAREQARTATAMLVTSRFEGYSLVILEARGHGCPVIAYDVKYGPGEQIADGEDGFVVPFGDREMLAERMLRLIREPGLADRLGRAARENVWRMQSPRAVVEKWREVLEAVVAARDRRTTLGPVKLRVTRLGHRRRHRLPDRLARGRLRRLGGRRSGSATFDEAPAVEFAGRLDVAGSSPAATFDDLRITLTGVKRDTGESVRLPLTIERGEEGSFQVSSTVAMDERFDALAGRGPVELRLRVVWHNSSWETMLARPARLAPGYEITFAADGTLALLRAKRPESGR
jgi:poly(glycerol-phosphate) alpha-glucosyltransferase